MKLYQAALKYHSDGAGSYEKATEAYEALFQSDIFKYPESQSELRRIELYGPLPEIEDLWLDDQEEAFFETPATGENAPSTLPQILHLSHKNYGDFMLRHLQHQTRDRLEATAEYTVQQISLAASSALDHFVEALDKDETDIDLWRRTSVLGEVLGSQRVARFCLEAVLDGDDEGLMNTLSLPGLSGSSAGQQLRELVSTMDDALSLLQSPLSDIGKRRVSKLLKQRLEMYGTIKRLNKSSRLDQSAQQLLDTNCPQRNVLSAPKTWSSFGELLSRQLSIEQNGVSGRTTSAGLAISFDGSVTSQTDMERKPLAAPDVMILDPTPLPIHPMDQFVGLDNGLPTVPLPAFGDLSALHAIPIDIGKGMPLPSRKRSSDIAGLQDSQDNGRLKSKRLRARESLADSGSILENPGSKIAQELEAEMEQIHAIDKWCFDSFNELLQQMAVPRFDIKPVTYGSGQGTHKSIEHTEDQPPSDIYAFLENFTETTSRSLLRPSRDIDVLSDAPQVGLVTAFDGAVTGPSSSVAKPALNPTAGLQEFMSTINQAWLRASDIAFCWAQNLLRPGSGILQPRLPPSLSSYAGHKWPEEVKTTVARIIVSLDNYLYRSMQALLETQQARCLESTNQSVRPLLDEEALQNIEMIQTIFELHLDVFSLVQMPNSGVDVDTVCEQEHRTQRWAELARDAMTLRSDLSNELDLADELNLRYLWATISHIKILSTISKEHITKCLQDLRDIFVVVGSPVIELPNNAVMPVLSTKALDREISKLTTSDFFNKMFDSTEGDPVSIIESLEPLLEYLHLDVWSEDISADVSPPSNGTDQAPDSTAEPDDAALELPASQDLIAYLKNSKSSMRLALWQRLRLAYQAIDYMPMVANCYFRTVETLVAEVRNSANTLKSQAERQTSTLRILKQIHDILNRFFEMTKIREDILECMDERRIRSLATALVQLLTLLHGGDVLEDEIRIGKRPAHVASNATEARAYQTSLQTLHNLQLNAWALLYLVLKEGAQQNREAFPMFDENRMEVFRSLHRAVGLRGFCGGANRVLLNLIKKEIVSLNHVDGFDLEYSQVLHDIYGLKTFVNPGFELLDHQCQGDAFLDRSAATQTIDLLLSQASKLKIADLAKHSLKEVIDRVNGVVARRKHSDHVLRNRDVYKSVFRSPIRPVDLYQSLSGQGNIDLLAVPESQTALAKKGWYFLMGHVALTKFRAQKRVVAGPTEDLDTAITFLMQDLEYGSEKWETWFRLAQAYDSKIEDSVMWSADKLNNEMPDIAQYQRSAIHCYIMATAQATRIEEAGFETSAKVAELYADFATRVYASSRAPFNMEAFSIEDTKRFLSTTGLITVKPFQPLTLYGAWKFAKNLYQRAIAGNPEKWFLHYMLSKCLWKMHTADEGQLPERAKTGYHPVIAALTRAIDRLPRERKDSKKETILEPHYKLAAIVHKLVKRNTINPAEACQILEATPYARKVTKVEEMDDWETYILGVLKNLRTADKSNWHHRMIARAADIIYAEGREGFASVIGAKHELTQQMFTKTMTLQAWKPETERAGRHFVYTARYTRLFVRILEQLNDRPSLEALAKRTRKRPGDYFEHNALWQDLCNSYLKVLRRYGQVPLGHETAIFSGIDHQEFLKKKDPLEHWCQDPEVKNQTLDVLRDTIEFKKINQNLMKPGAIDDLIGDAYAYLYDTVGKKLWSAQMQDETERKDAESAKESERRQQQALAEGKASMSLNNLMNLDGTAPPSQETSPTAPAPPLPAEIKTEAGQTEQASAKRKVGVGRREIRTCAEACLAKPGTTSTAQSSTAPVDRVQIIIEKRKSSVLSPPSGTIDSADESELSELSDMDDDDDDGDEDSVNHANGEVVLRPMFPGLLRREHGLDILPNEDDDDDDDEEEEQAEDGDDEADLDEAGGHEHEHEEGEDVQMADGDVEMDDHENDDEAEDGVADGVTNGTV